MARLGDGGGGKNAADSCNADFKGKIVSVASELSPHFPPIGFRFEIIDGWKTLRVSNEWKKIPGGL